MRARFLDHTATRSGAFARRAGAVALAAAVVAAPLAVAAPASAATSDYITSVAFPSATISGGQNLIAYFNGDTTLTEVAADGVCSAAFNGTEILDYTYVSSANAALPYDYYTEEYGIAPGDTVSVGFYDQDSSREDGLDSCYPPALADIAVQASVVWGQPTPPAPEPAPYVEIALSAPDVRLTRGVAVDADIPFSTAGLDFTANGGFIGFGPQFGNEPPAGYVDPYTGVEVTILDEQIPGVTPRIHIQGTPKYSSVIETGFFVGDGTTTGVSELKIIIADKDGAITPITIDVANGAAVTGAPVALITGGLKEGAAWNATVRSTPIVVGAGVIDGSGTLNTTVNIPAGLAAGLHTITLASTAADGAPFTSVLYFAISPTGTLLSVSATQATALAALPQLAATGTDIAPSVLVAGGLLLAGAAFVGVTAIRRRRNA